MNLLNILTFVKLKKIETIMTAMWLKRSITELKNDKLKYMYALNFLFGLKSVREIGVEQPGKVN